MTAPAEEYCRESGDMVAHGARLGYILLSFVMGEIHYIPNSVDPHHPKAIRCTTRLYLYDPPGTRYLGYIEYLLN